MCQRKFRPIKYTRRQSYAKFGTFLLGHQVFFDKSGRHRRSRCPHAAVLHVINVHSDVGVVVGGPHCSVRCHFDHATTEQCDGRAVDCDSVCTRLWTEHDDDDDDLPSNSESLRTERHRRPHTTTTVIVPTTDQWSRDRWRPLPKLPLPLGVSGALT